MFFENLKLKNWLKKPVLQFLIFFKYQLVISSGYENSVSCNGSLVPVLSPAHDEMFQIKKIATITGFSYQKNESNSPSKSVEILITKNVQICDFIIEKPFNVEFIQKLINIECFLHFYFALAKCVWRIIILLHETIHYD